MSEPAQEFEAIWAATQAVRRVIAQSKNPRTELGRMDPTGVAYHVALAAIAVHCGELGECQRRQEDAILCAGCAGFDHCDGREGDCDCTCGLPPDWAGPVGEWKP